MAIDKIKRNFLWLRKALGIIDKTTLPGDITGEVRPTIDILGWDRLADLGAGNIETVAGTFEAPIVVLSVVPEGVARFVIYASCSHNDAAGLVLNLQVRSSGVDIGLGPTFDGGHPQPALFGLTRNILLQPGEQLICTSTVNPAVGTRLFITMKFVDLDPGEYLPPIN